MSLHAGTPHTTSQHAADRVVAFPHTHLLARFSAWMRGTPSYNHPITITHSTRHLPLHTATGRRMVTVRTTKSSHDRRTRCPCLACMPRGSQGEGCAHGVRPAFMVLRIYPHHAPSSCTLNMATGERRRGRVAHSFIRVDSSEPGRKCLLSLLAISPVSPAWPTHGSPSSCPPASFRGHTDILSPHKVTMHRRAHSRLPLATQSPTASPALALNCLQPA